jgi:hypothetical protein
MSSIIRATTTSGLQVAPDNSGSLQLQTNGTTTAVTIDTSQNVGIGTTSPSSKLNVNGKVTLTGGEDNQIEWNNNSQLWRLNNSSAGQFYLYDVTGAKFPFKINAGSGNDSIAITSTSTAFGVGGTERMRIDSSGNLLFNSGHGSVATAYGCRAWVNFNGTGTVAIRASGNVTSITDNGTGDYTVNFTNAMPNVNYSFTACVTRTSGQALTVLMNNESTVPATGSLRLLCVSQNASAGTATDSTNVCIAIFR